MNAPSWSRISAFRAECGQRFGTIRELPLCDGYREVVERLGPATRVLDVGAGVAQPLRARVLGERRTYATLDADPAGTFDYRSFADVPAGVQFDMVVAHQVLEHLPIPEGGQLVADVFARLAPGGLFIASVPNAAHPVRQWGDATHITAWPLGDFYGLLRSAGFDVVAMKRSNKQAYPWNPLKRLVIRWVCEVFRVDWCDTLLIVGKRPAGG